MKTHPQAYHSQTYFSVRFLLKRFHPEQKAVARPLAWERSRFLGREALGVVQRNRSGGGWLVSEF